MQYNTKEGYRIFESLNPLKSGLLFWLWVRSCIKVYSKSLNPLKSGLLFWYRFFYSSKCERRVSIPSNRVFSSDWAWPPTILVAPVVSIPSNRVFSSDRARNPVFCDAGWVSIPSNRVFSSDMETIKINGEDVRSQSPQIGSSLLIKFIHFKSV